MSDSLSLRHIRRRAGVWGIMALAASGFSASPLHAEAPRLVTAEEAPSRVVVRTGVVYEVWDEDRDDSLGEPLEQGTATVSAPARLSPRIKLDFFGGYAVSDWNENGSVSGLRDTRVGLTFRVAPQAALAVRVNAPTGVTEHPSEDLPVALAVASRMKGYQTNELGEGFDVQVSAAYALNAGSASVGLGVGYLLTGAYTFVEGQPEIDPGNQVTVTAGVDMGGEDRLFRLQGSLDLYGQDQLDAGEAFEFGDRWQVESLYRARSESFGWEVRGRAILYAKSTALGPEPLTPEASQIRGNEYYLDGVAELPVARDMRLLGLVGGRVFSDNDAGLGDGYRVDAGAGLRIATSKTLWVTGQGRASMGTQDDVDLKGVAVELSLTGSY